MLKNFKLHIKKLKSRIYAYLFFRSATHWKYAKILNFLNTHPLIFATGIFCVPQKAATEKGLAHATTGPDARLTFYPRSHSNPNLWLDIKQLQQSNRPLDHKNA